jgi:hypothetical protein
MADVILIRENSEQIRKIIAASKGGNNNNLAEGGGNQIFPNYPGVTSPQQTHTQKIFLTQGEYFGPLNCRASQVPPLLQETR